jgi:hypothetical protein
MDCCIFAIVQRAKMLPTKHNPILGWLCRQGLSRLAVSGAAHLLDFASHFISSKKMDCGFSAIVPPATNQPT